MAIAKKKNPKLWESCKRQAKAKMGGKHSARAMQLAVACYKKKGGKYEGSKKSSNKLSKWSKQDWGYAGKKGDSAYLPKSVRKSATKSQLATQNARKRAANKAGKSKATYTKAIAKKVRNA
tara:strand:- start:207 stop:569 length:363 start_codon:yes stop_codon:yes gene_type:complete